MSPAKAGRPTATVPLARALSKLGIASRSQAVALIRGGRVSVDGQVVTDPARPVVPERIRVEIEGERAERAPWITILLHKPRGVVTTRRDPEGRSTVLDLVSDAPARVMPVGRLDLASSGLLLLTSDTRFADWVMDPRNAVPRTYAVTVRGFVADDEIERVVSGLDDDGDRVQAQRVEVRKRSRRETHLVIELTEGKNREVRRLCAAIGHEVTRLKRISLGGLELGSLVPGAWREVPREELQRAFPGAPIGPPSHGKT